MIQLWSISDIGLVRKENQDTCAVYRCDEYAAGVVCDGMGGTAGGKTASIVAAHTFLEEFDKLWNPEMTPEQVKEMSSYAVSVANNAIGRVAEETPEFANMGTTLVAAVMMGENAVISNVGDSRAYLIREDSIVKITRDHSLVEQMVEQGTLTEEEARRHPKRNLITRALGPDTIATCDGYLCTVKPGEYLLLCSDGLVNTVSDQEILFEVLHGGDPDTCLDRLMAISKANGAPDNVTVVLMKNA